MSRKTEFATWLYKQAERADPVGDLARYASEDENAPRWAFRIETWRKYLRSRKAPPYLTNALEQAFEQWITKGRRTTSNSKSSAQSPHRV